MRPATTIARTACISLLLAAPLVCQEPPRDTLAVWVSGGIGAASEADVLTLASVWFARHNVAIGLHTSLAVCIFCVEKHEIGIVVGYRPRSKWLKAVIGGGLASTGSHSNCLFSCDREPDSRGIQPIAAGELTVSDGYVGIGFAWVAVLGNPAPYAGAAIIVQLGRMP